MDGWVWVWDGGAIKSWIYGGDIGGGLDRYGDQVGRARCLRGRSFDIVALCCIRLVYSLRPIETSAR